MLNFLLVEDDEDHARLIARMLTKNGVTSRVDNISDGASALRYLDGDHPYEQRSLPDVILLDLNLPKVSGLEVLERLKSDDQLKTIPVVILSSSAAETDRIRAYRHHANSYLVKPVAFETFREMIQSLGLYWGRWNQPMPPGAAPSTRRN